MLIHLQCQVVNGVVNWVLLEVLRWYHLPQRAHILATGYSTTDITHEGTWCIITLTTQINHMNFSSP